MIAFVDEHRQTQGIEPICKVSPIAPSTYHDQAAKRADPGKLWARRDGALKGEMRRVFEANFPVHGTRKVSREGKDVARRTVARLMKAMALQGVIRGEPAPEVCSRRLDRSGGRAATPESGTPGDKAIFGAPHSVEGVAHRLAEGLETTDWRFTLRSILRLLDGDG